MTFTWYTKDESMPLWNSSFDIIPITGTISLYVRHLQLTNSIQCSTLSTVFHDDKPSCQERFLNFSYPWTPNVIFDACQRGLCPFKTRSISGTKLFWQLCSVLCHFALDLKKLGNAEMWFQCMYSVRVRRAAPYIIQTSRFMAHALNLIFVAGIVIKFRLCYK